MRGALIREGALIGTRTAKSNQYSQLFDPFKENFRKIKRVHGFSIGVKQKCDLSKDPGYSCT